MSAGWDALHAATAIARQEIAAHAPDADILAEGEAYVMRVVTASLAEASLEHLFVDGGLGRALLTRGGPNPDYIIASGRIDPTRRYHLSGHLNASERVGVGLYALGENGAPVEVGYTVFDASNVDAAGCFDIALASDASRPGALPIPADCRIIIARILHRAQGQPPARLSLSGGENMRGLALATGTSEGALARAAQGVIGSVREYLKWTRAVAAAPNRLAIPPTDLAATVQGDRETHYYLGYFDLGTDEWLEVTLPEELPGYWSLHVYNHWFESLQVAGVHDRNATKDPDGRIRIRLGPSVPGGMRNPIDTLDRRRGALICRIIGAEEISVPETRLVQTAR